MTDNHKDRNIIFRYLSNSLSGTELKDFMERIESDSDFRRKVSFQADLVDGILSAENKRLIAKIEESIGYRKPAVPFALKLTFTFLIVTGLGIIFWNYIEDDSGNGKQKYSLREYFYEKVREIPAGNEKQPSKKTVPPSKTSAAIPADTLPVQATANADSVTAVAFESATGNTSDNIVIKKDQLIATHTYPVHGLSKTDEEASMAAQTASSLNPSGGLPDESSRQHYYSVEFWISPVNYKGYKLSGEKLILFGLDEPSLVSLFNYEGSIWIKYGNEFYETKPTEEYEAFVRSREIPEAIK